MLPQHPYSLLLSLVAILPLPTLGTHMAPNNHLSTTLPNTINCNPITYQNSEYFRFEEPSQPDLVYLVAADYTYFIQLNGQDNSSITQQAHYTLFPITSTPHPFQATVPHLQHAPPPLNTTQSAVFPLAPPASFHPFTNHTDCTLPSLHPPHPTQPLTSTQKPPTPPFLPTQAQNATLAGHLNTTYKPSHTKKKIWECRYCRKEFYKKFNWQQHERTHTGEKPFKCTYCEKAFSQAHSLKQHIRIHTGEKPFECKYCEKKFNVKTNAEMHFNTHTGEKPFQCVKCLKRFASRSGLSGHKKKCKPNIPHYQGDAAPWP